MRSTLVSCVLFATFFVLERVLRQGDEAVSLEAGPSDRGTSGLIAVGFASTLASGLLAPVLGRLGPGKTAGPGPIVAGQGMMLAGLAMKVWAMRTLGRFYTRTLRTAADQTVVQDGSYRLVRHPGYVGTLLIWAGFGWAMRNWLLGLLNTMVLLAVYGRRIQVEEAMLAETLGEPYREYQRRTWRLVPGLI
jgi:protein-S-isoprenylcysteine O-methyltransferase Ste14